MDMTGISFETMGKQMLKNLPSMLPMIGNIIKPPKKSLEKARVWVKWIFMILVIACIVIWLIGTCIFHYTPLISDDEGSNENANDNAEKDTIAIIDEPNTSNPSKSSSTSNSVEE